jgi:hypothetical protein
MKKLCILPPLPFFFVVVTKGMQQVCILSSLPFCCCCDFIVIKRNVTTFDDIYNHDIHLNIIRYEDDEEYGKFVCLAKVQFKDFKKHWISREMHLGHFFFCSTTIRQPKHVVSLALHCKLLAVLLLLMMM